MTSKEVVTELYKERAYAYENKVCHKGDGWKEAIDHYDNIGECLIQIEKDLEALDVIKKFFFIEAYSDKRLNSDFCKITAIEDKEANIDRSALSFIDRDSLKILKEWLENDK